MAKQGNAGYNDFNQKTIEGGKGAKMNDQGFGEDQSKATGSAGMGRGQKSKSEYCNIPDGQIVTG